MGASVIVLSNEFTPIGIVDWKKAAKLIYCQKAEVLVKSEKKLHETLFLPKIIKLVKTINKIWKIEVSWSKSNVLIRDEYKCGYCGIQLSKNNATIDHIIPKSADGKNTWENTICSCKHCNKYKGDNFLEKSGLSLRTNPYKPKMIQFLIKKLKIEGKLNIFEEYENFLKG